MAEEIFVIDTLHGNAGQTTFDAPNKRVFAFLEPSKLYSFYTDL